MPEHPKDLNFSEIVVDIKFHPEKDVIAAGTIEGQVILHSYSCTAENSELLTFNEHKKSCRALQFSSSGEDLHTASKDKSIHTLDLNTGSVKRKIKNAHESPIYSLLVTGENMLVTGDDDGHIKAWDLRMQKEAMDLKESEEFISDLAVDSQFKTLLATSGEGTLTAINLRKKKLEMQSELFDSEFLSLAIVKRGKKVVCGCGEGALNIFNWGEWGNLSDRFPGHPMSIDCMVPITEDIVCTGSCDGLIRAVNILPNRFLGVVGEHKGDFPIENLALSRDKKFLASCSHDQMVKFWNIESVKKEKVDIKKKAKKTDKSKFLKSSNQDDFFADLVDNTEEEKASGSKDDNDSGNHSDNDEAGSDDGDDDDE